MYSIYIMYIYIVYMLCFDTLYKFIYLYVVYIYIYVYNIYESCRSTFLRINFLKSIRIRTEKSFWSFIRLNWNQIVVTTFRLIRNTNGCVHLCSKSIVNTIWFGFDIVRFRKDFAVCVKVTQSWMNN